MAAITLSGVGKTYAGGVAAVSDVDLDIADGEFIVLVGPSGCGKSTLLRMIAGLETITDGVVSIAGREVNRLEPAERDIAMVFQNYALYPHMSVRENLSYGLRNRRTPKAEIARRVEDAARILEITPYLERKPRALSGGQRQRVAMGRAIVREPSAFLFDEPLSNLDAKLRISMRVEIRELQRRLGVTSVYVTHDQLEAMTLADRLVVLRAGRVEQIGAPMEVYRRPASTFVAEFIGSPAMNLLDAHVQDGRLRAGGAELGPVDLPGGPITLGLRAEALSRACDGTPASGGMPAKLVYVEEVGAHRLAHLRVGDQKLVAVFAPDAELSDSMRLIAPRDAWHLFDAQSGARL